MAAGDQFRGPEYRVCGFAMFDTILTLLFSIIFVYLGSGKLFNTFVDKSAIVSVLCVFIILIILSVFAHKIAGSKTVLSYRLGLSEEPDIVIANKKNQ